MKRQEATLRRLLLGDDGTAEVRAKQMAEARKIERDDEKVLVYLAQEASKASLERDEVRRAKSEKKELREKEKATAAAQQPTAPPVTESSKSQGYDAELEEAIVQSLLESTKSSEGQQSTSERRNDLRSRLLMEQHQQASSRTPPISRSTPEPAKPEDPLSDPAVVAFMEKRKQRQQMQKEETLQKSLAEEAQRLAAEMPSLAIADHTHHPHSSRSYAPSPAMAPTPPPPSGPMDPVFDIPLISAPSDRERPSSSRKVEKSIPAPVYYAPVPPVSMPTPPPEPVKMAVEEYDPMHILHPNNATALRAMTAVLQLARRQYKEMHDSEFITKEGAAIQLASIWLNQTATYLFKQKEREQRTSQSYASPPVPPHAAPPLALHTPVSAGASYGSPAMRGNFSPDDYSPAPAHPHTLTSKRSSSQNNMHMLINASAISETPTNIPTRDMRRTMSAGSQRLSIDWICPVCTLLNKGAYLQCDACGCEAPQIL